MKELTEKLAFVMKNGEPQMHRTVRFTIEASYKLTRVRKGLRTTSDRGRVRMKA